MGVPEAQGERLPLTVGVRLTEGLEVPLLLLLPPPGLALPLASRALALGLREALGLRLV